MAVNIILCLYVHYSVSALQYDIVFTVLKCLTGEVVFWKDSV